MIGPKIVIAAALLLASSSRAQLFQYGDRSEDAYTWVQPEDTTVLTQYGDSEPVYPSRMPTSIPFFGKR